MLDSETDLWESYLKCYNGDIPDEIEKTMRTISFPGFQNIQMAFKILATMLVTFVHVKGYSRQCVDSKLHKVSHDQ